MPRWKIALALLLGAMLLFGSAAMAEDEACDHPSYWMEEEKVLWEDPIERYDSVCHIYRTESTRIYRCEVCGETFEETGPNSVLEAHVWNTEDGLTCAYCGEPNPCEHPNARQAISTGYPSAFTPVDRDTHIGECEITTYNACDDCGATWGSVITTEMEVFPHSFIDGYFCDGCGMINPCSHDGEYERISEIEAVDEYEPLDERTHKHIHSETAVVECLICHALLEAATPPVETIEEHQRGEDAPKEGICALCGGEYAIPYDFELTSLTADVSTAIVGQQITLTTGMTGTDPVLEMEYHVYNQQGQHISGWNGISGAYYYTATAPGTYTFRVYVRTAAGWADVDSAPVTVKEAAATRMATALTPDSATATVGDVLTFTTQFAGTGDIAWIEYHIYDAYGNHLTGYRGEGDGISGVYNYPTASIGAGKYTARVYLMAKDGTFTTVDSMQVTVVGNGLKVVGLEPDSTTAKVGDVLVFTTRFAGEGDIAWIEYHIYDTQGQHLTGYRGEGDGISGVYNYPTVNTGAGKYTARVYLMAKDGTFTQVDSVQVTVTE